MKSKKNNIESENSTAVHKYMTLNYPVLITKVVEDGEKYYKVEVPDLYGLCIYVDRKEDIDKELADSKRVWFASRLKYNQEIPLPKDYSNN